MTPKGGTMEDRAKHIREARRAAWLIVALGVGIIAVAVLGGIFLTRLGIVWIWYGGVIFGLFVIVRGVRTVRQVNKAQRQ
jgi:MFS family permease